MTHLPRECRSRSCNNRFPTGCLREFSCIRDVIKLVCRAPLRVIHQGTLSIDLLDDLEQLLASLEAPDREAAPDQGGEERCSTAN